MNKNTLLRGVLALGLTFSLSLPLAACSPTATDPKGSSAPVSAAPTAAPALTEEEYLTKMEELGTQMTEIQTSAASIDPTNVEAAKTLLNDMKAPFVAFAALTPPEKYVDAHTKLQSGCNGMAEYLDIILQIMEEPDATKQQELSTKMMEVVTAAVTDITEGGQMLSDAG